MKRAALTPRETKALDSLTTEDDLRTLVYAIVHTLNEALAPSPYHVLVVYGVRTFVEQRGLFAKGRTAPGAIVTNALPEQSAHCYRAAADIAIVYDHDDPATPNLDETNTWLPANHPQWDRLATLVRESGLVTGSDFKSLRDRAHMELANWRELVAAGELTGVEG